MNDDFDLLSHDANTRMRWYAQMNAWGTPSEFPRGFVEAGRPAVRNYKDEFPKWNAALRTIQGSLSEEQMSWGWWREEKIGSFDEWRAWFKGPVTIDENGDPL